MTIRMITRESKSPRTDWLSGKGGQEGGILQKTYIVGGTCFIFKGVCVNIKGVFWSSYHATVCVKYEISQIYVNRLFTVPFIKEHFPLKNVLFYES